jgi:anti-anti-sigma factor
MPDALSRPAVVNRTTESERSQATAGPVDAGPVVVIDDSDLVLGLRELRAGVAVMVRSGSRRMVVDVSRLRALSSTTVTALLWAQRRCRARGGEVVLRGAGRSLRRGLRDSGLSHSFRIEADGMANGGGLPQPRTRGSRRAAG